MNNLSTFSLLYVEDDPCNKEILGAALATNYPVMRLLLAENGAIGLGF
jgi:hypothetical protein